MALSCSNQLIAQTTITLETTTLTEREVAVGIEVPWEITWGPDDHIWVTERRGQVLRVNPENGNIETILDIKNKVENNGEPGLLGLALHPDFDTTPKVYLVYNFVFGGFNIGERLVSFDWDGSQLINETTLINDIPGGNIHNGARLLITPDNKILMTTGDTGSGSLSQDLSSLNGKLLRINLDGSIPTDNPDPNSYIYSYGHRNSQGLAYGADGQLYSSEHGAQQSDEFNRIEVNRNYGWPNVQGQCNTTSEVNFCNQFNVVEPLAEWSPCVAVNDICYYDHPAIPEWQNSMLMAVLGGFARLPRLSVLKFNTDGSAIESEEQYFDNYGRLRDVCINPHNGAIFFATNGIDYPSYGPNKIIEYRNLDYMVSDVKNTIASDQYMTVYPNPVTSNQSVQVSLSETFMGNNYQLISYDGSLILDKKIQTKDITIDTNGIPKGSYYIIATNDKGSITRSIIIQ